VLELMIEQIVSCVLITVSVHMVALHFASVPLLETLANKRLIGWHSDCYQSGVNPPSQFREGKRKKNYENIYMQSTAILLHRVTGHVAGHGHSQISISHPQGRRIRLARFDRARHHRWHPDHYFGVAHQTWLISPPCPQAGAGWRNPTSQSREGKRKKKYEKNHGRNDPQASEVSRHGAKCGWRMCSSRG